MVAIKSTISPFRIFGRLAEAILLDPLDTVRYANPCEVVILPTNNNRIGHIEEDNYEEETNNPSLGGERGGIYPNPNDGRVTINYELNATQLANLIIMDIMGKVLYQQELSSTKTVEQLNLIHLSKGVYLYTIQVNGESKQNGKLVIQK